MNSNIAVLTFEDYSALAHGIAKHLNVDVKGSQVLNSMAKARGFKTAQAFKASFSALPLSPRVYHPDSTSVRLGQYLSKLVRSEISIELNSDYSDLLEGMKNWVFVYGGERENYHRLSLFDFLTEIGIHLKPQGALKISHDRDGARTLNGIDAMLVNEAYLRYSSYGVAELERYKKDDAQYYRYLVKNYAYSLLVLSFNHAIDEFLAAFYDALENLLVGYFTKRNFGSSESPMNFAKFVDDNDAFMAPEFMDCINGAMLTANAAFVNRESSLISTNQDMVIRLFKDGSPASIRRNILQMFPGHGGDSEMWKGRLSAFLGALIPILFYQRENDGVVLDLDVISERSSLDALVGLVHGDDLSSDLMRPMWNYLCNLPGFSDDDSRIGQLHSRVYGQHSQVTGMLMSILGNMDFRS
jgi:hypothetical protein